MKNRAITTFSWKEIVRSIKITLDDLYQEIYWKISARLIRKSVKGMKLHMQEEIHEEII